MPAAPRIVVVDITSADSGRRFAAELAALNTYLKDTLHERHSVDISKSDISGDKMRLYRTHLSTLLAKIALFIAAAGLAAGIALTIDVYGQRLFGHGYESVGSVKLLVSLYGSIKLRHWIILFIILFGYVLVKLRSVRQRSLAPRAHEILKQDQRKPCLLIRSFLDDAIPIYTKDQFSNDLEETRFEEAVAPALRSIGPLVAVGDPRATLPELGAARARFPNDNWQAPVLQLIRQSRIIALLSDIAEAPPEQLARAIANRDALSLLMLTPGVQWEVDNIRDEGHLDKMLIVLKPRTPSMVSDHPIVSQYAAVVDFVTPLERSTQVDASNRLDFRGALALNIGRDGSLFLVSSSRRLLTIADYQLAIRIAAYQMLLGRSDSGPL